MTHTPEYRFALSFGADGERVTLKDSSRGHRHEDVLTLPYDDAAKRLLAFEAMREACRLLVDSYVAEAGTYALGELSQAREKASAALKLTEDRS